MQRIVFVEDDAELGALIKTFLANMISMSRWFPVVIPPCDHFAGKTRSGVAGYHVARHRWADVMPQFVPHYAGP